MAVKEKLYTPTETASQEINSVTTPPIEKPAEDIGGFCVYIGPSIRGVIQSGTIYSKPRVKMLGELSETIKKYPQIANLIVPGNDLASARIKVKVPGNMLNEYYMQLAAGQKF